MQTAQRIPIKPILAQVVAYSVDRRPQHHPPNSFTSQLHDFLHMHTDQIVTMTAIDSSGIMIHDGFKGSLIPQETEDRFAGQHTALRNVCIINCQTGERIVPNSVPDKLENDCFSGEVLMLLRTPDVDDPNEVEKDMGETPRRISDYMKDKSMRFEFQFQVKLKKVPTGPLFLGCELEHPIHTSQFTKGIAGVLLSMIGRINKGFHYSWGTDIHSTSEIHPTDPHVLKGGLYEKTHLAFPVEASMDRIIVTKPGETPPKLGEELLLHESSESVKRRRRMGAGSIDWNLEDTYTMCLWSAYCDWIQWKSLNVPGVRPFSIHSVAGKQPIYLSVYELYKITPQEYREKRPYHNRKDLRVYTRLELSHSSFTEGGLAEALALGVEKYPCNSDCGSLSTESIQSDTESEEI